MTIGCLHQFALVLHGCEISALKLISAFLYAEIPLFFSFFITFQPFLRFLALFSSFYWCSLTPLIYPVMDGHLR
jgi:hypothetical protein